MEERQHQRPEPCGITRFTYDAELQGKHRARSVIGSDTWVTVWVKLSTRAFHLRCLHERVDVLVRIYQRYQSSIALDLFRLLHELERAQRMRKGEQVPAPAVVDITVGTHSSLSDEPLQKVILEGSVSTESNKQEDSVPGPATGKDEAGRPNSRTSRRRLTKDSASECP